jgi:16S rRNA (cytidine1402-2'-O)-methyltransferase
MDVDERSQASDGQAPRKPPLAPGLHIVATPIGNLGDITLRALSTLAACDAILCEDTRLSARLLSRYGITTKLSPYHDHNAAKLRPQILERLQQGACLALISDAGMPLISDPGFKLVREAIDGGVHVEVIPGVSASLTALALSGLPTDRFMFCGFLPPKQGERRRAIAAVEEIKATLIFFESPNRIVETLHDLATALPHRLLAVSRELTKLHEETLRGSAADVLAVLEQRPVVKGEITLVVGPPPELEALASQADIDRALREAAQTLSSSQAAAEVARNCGIGKKAAYSRLLELRAIDSDQG